MDGTIRDPLLFDRYPGGTSLPALGTVPAAGHSLVCLARARRRLAANGACDLKRDLVDRHLGHLRRRDSRIAIVHAAAMRQTSTTDALRFALSHAGPLIVAPLCPLFGVAFLAVICRGIGLLYRVPTVGPTLSGIALVFPLAAGLVMTLLVAGLVAGWPLLQAATASGAEDSLDALSRIFGYLNQRLGAYLALVALAWLLGMLGLGLIDIFTVGAVRLTHWGLSLTAPIAATESFFGTPATASSPTIAGTTHAFWLGLVRLIAHGWVFSFFWTAAAYLYLWLRQEIDGVPWYEIEPHRA